MSKLDKGQRRVLADFYANTAVAWFSAGVIGPIIIRPQSLVDLFPTLVLSLVLTVVYIKLSLEVARQTI